MVEAVFFFMEDGKLRALCRQGKVEIELDSQGTGSSLVRVIKRLDAGNVSRGNSSGRWDTKLCFEKSLAPEPRPCPHPILDLK